MSPVINIYTVVYMKPEFIFMQTEYLKKYCTDNYKLWVINNGKDDATRRSIDQYCREYKAECIAFNRPPNVQEGCSQSHAVALEYALINFIKKANKNDITVIMDSDVFPFKQFSFITILNSKDIAGMYQQRMYKSGTEYVYLSAIFTMFKNSIDISNFSFHKGIGDTGSGTAELIQKYPTEFINHTAAIDIESEHIFRGEDVKKLYRKEYRCQFLANTFIHYYRGSNWAESDPKYHERKLDFVKAFLQNPEPYKINLDSTVSYSTAHSDKGHNGVDHNYKNYRFVK